MFAYDYLLQNCVWYRSIWKYFKVCFKDGYLLNSYPHIFYYDKQAWKCGFIVDQNRIQKLTESPRGNMYNHQYTSLALHVWWIYSNVYMLLTGIMPKVIMQESHKASFNSVLKVQNVDVTPLRSEWPIVIVIKTVYRVRVRVRNECEKMKMNDEFQIQ